MDPVALIRNPDIEVELWPLKVVGASSGPRRGNIVEWERGHVAWAWAGNHRRPTRERQS